MVLRYFLLFKILRQFFQFYLLHFWLLNTLFFFSFCCDLINSNFMRLLKSFSQEIIFSMLRIDEFFFFRFRCSFISQFSFLFCELGYQFLQAGTQIHHQIIVSHIYQFCSDHNRSTSFCSFLREEEEIMFAAFCPLNSWMFIQRTEFNHESDALFLYSMTGKHLVWALLLTTVLTCHYSCSTCVRPYYSACVLCSNGGTFQTVEDPATTPLQYWSSVYKVGTCIATYSTGSNILGILLFVVLAAMCLFLRSKESFYLMLAIQSLGLVNLVQTAWVNPLGYVLESAQHLMIFNILGKAYKTSDFLLKVTGYHRIFNYLQQCSIGQNIAIIAVFSLIALILLIIIAIILRCRRNNQKKENTQNNREIVFEAMQNTSKEPTTEPEAQECSSWLTNDALAQIAKMLLAILTLSVQQTMLVLLVAVVFIRPIVSGLIVLCIFYLLILGYILSYSYYIRMEYFQDRRILFLTFARKIILPVLVVVPLDKQYLFFLFALVISLCEFIVDFRNGLYSKLSRLVFYKCAQLLSLVLLMIYYIVEIEGGNLAASRIAAICGVVAIGLMFSCVAIELPFAVKERFFTQQPSKEVNNDLRNETVEQIAPEDEKGHVPILQLSSIRRDDTAQEASIIVEENNGKDNKEEKKTQDQTLNVLRNSQIQDSQIKNSQLQIEVAPTAPIEPVRRKKRKQMIDKELRMRYGI